MSDNNERPITAPAPAFTDLLRQNHSCTIQAGKPLCRFSEAQDGEWVHITDLRRWIGERPAPSPVTVSDEMVERACEAYKSKCLSIIGVDDPSVDWPENMDRACMRAALIAYESTRGAGINIMRIVDLCHGIKDAAKRRETKSVGTVMCAVAAEKILRELRTPPPTDKAREEMK